MVPFLEACCTTTCRPYNPVCLVFIISYSEKNIKPRRILIVGPRHLPAAAVEDLDKSYVLVPVLR